MTCEQIVDKVADDRIRFVAELGHNPADERAAARVPFQIDGAVKIARAMYFRPAMRAPRLFGPDLDETKFLIQLRIAHDLVAQRSVAGCDHLNHCLHFGRDAALRRSEPEWQRTAQRAVPTFRLRFRIHK
jgi:hypothetical protein